MIEDIPIAEGFLHQIKTEWVLSDHADRNMLPKRCSKDINRECSDLCPLFISHAKIKDETEFTQVAIFCGCVPVRYDCTIIRFVEQTADGYVDLEQAAKKELDEVRDKLLAKFNPVILPQDRPIIED